MEYSEKKNTPGKKSRDYIGKLAAIALAGSFLGGCGSIPPEYKKGLEGISSIFANFERAETKKIKIDGVEEYARVFQGGFDAYYLGNPDSPDMIVLDPNEDKYNFDSKPNFHKYDISGKKLARIIHETGGIGWEWNNGATEVLKTGEKVGKVIAYAIPYNPVYSVHINTDDGTFKFDFQNDVSGGGAAGAGSGAGSGGGASGAAGSSGGAGSGGK